MQPSFDTWTSLFILATAMGLFLFIMLRVYDTIGKLVDTIQISETSIWDANKLTDGIYFLVAERNGTRAYQRIIVSKQ